MVGVVAHDAVDLRGEHHVVAPAGERLAGDLLRLAARVDVGGVDEVDTGVEGGVDDPGAVAGVLVAPLAEHHRPGAVRRDLYARRAKGAVAHGATLTTSRALGPPAREGRVAGGPPTTIGPMATPRRGSHTGSR